MSIDVLDCISRFVLLVSQEGTSVCSSLGFRFARQMLKNVGEGQDTIARANRWFGLLIKIGLSVSQNALRFIVILGFVRAV